MGTWSLAHATALKDAGVEVAVVSLTPSIPSFASKLAPRVAFYSNCPEQWSANGIQVNFPRWYCYPITQFWGTMGKAPEQFLSLGWRSARRSVFRLVDSIRPDMILANHSLVNGYVAGRIKQETKVPFVTVDHESGDFEMCISNQKWKKVLDFVTDQSALGITVSKSMQKIAEKANPQGTYQTIYNGADFSVSKPSLGRHVEKDELTIFCCANFYERKDIPLLIRAFAKLKAMFPNVSLRIAGDGPDKDRILACIGEVDCTESVILLGLISQHRVQEEMNRADIFALVGWGEPFGVVFLEALANGCPVVLSEDAGAAEILKDGETALFTKPRNEQSVLAALTRLCHSADERRRIAESGHSYFDQRCTWRSRAQEYLEVFEHVIGLS